VTTLAAVQRVEEKLAGGPVPLYQHPDWVERFPWLLQGTTGRGDDGSFDLGLGGSQPVGTVLNRWRLLLEALEVPAAAHSRQVHGAELHLHRQPPVPGLLVMDRVDGQATSVPGLLMSVSVADCVPLFLVAPRRRVAALLHAGWRGVAAGILEDGMQLLQREFGAAARELWLHCGPSICERCYEVGPEVHRQLRPLSRPPAAARAIDLRGVLLERAFQRGIRLEHCSISRHCTRCGGGGLRAFFSHRAGETGRQMALLGIRPLRCEASRQGAPAAGAALS
jgi:polyphenol oxidase